MSNSFLMYVDDIAQRPFNPELPHITIHDCRPSYQSSMFDDDGHFRTLHALIVIIISGIFGQI